MKRGASTVMVLVAAASSWAGAAGCGSRPLDLPGPAGAPSPLFVAVGAKGTIVTSPDGRAWTARPWDASVILESVAAGPSRFVAVGGNGAIVSSPDGIAWTRAKSPTTTHLSHVIYAGDRFVAVGADWTNGAVTVSSADGVTWAAIPSPASHMFHGVAHAGGNLIAAAYFRSDLQTPAQFHATQDGAWTQRQGPDFYKSLEAAGMLLVTGGRRSVSVSTDNGLSWETQALDTTDFIVGLAFNGATFVAVGELGDMFTSADGRVWLGWENSLGGEGSSSGVANGGGTFVAVGTPGRVVASGDGVTWTTHPSATPERLHDVAYGPTR